MTVGVETRKRKLFSIPKANPRIFDATPFGLANGNGRKIISISSSSHFVAPYDGFITFVGLTK